MTAIKLLRKVAIFFVMKAEVACNDRVDLQ